MRLAETRALSEDGTQIERWTSTTYRVRNRAVWSAFASIERCGRVWHVEIRDSETGKIVRFGGMWDTKRDAVNEAVAVLARDFRMRK